MTEMLIVLLIIAILSTTLLGAYGRMQRNTRLTNSADKVLSTLALAKSLAISNNTIYHVRLEHWENDTATGADRPHPEPLLKVFCYPKYTDAVNAPADPEGTSHAWSYRGTLKDPATGAAYTTGAGPINNYLVESVKLDRATFVGQHFYESIPGADDRKQNNLISFNPDGTANQTNQTGVYTLYVTDIEKLARPITDAADRRSVFNKEPGAKFPRSNVIMIDVLPGGIIRLRKENLP